MRLSLLPHPSTPSEVVTGIEVRMAREADHRLVLDYVVTADLERLRLPPEGEGGRADELWRSTCLEAFFATGEGGYYELNVAPSHQWAAYRFRSYRAGMARADELAPTRIKTEDRGWTLRWFGRPNRRGRFSLQVAIPLPADAAGPVGLAAIMEEVSGAKSYWALAHPPGAPDFHHPDCFIAQLPPPPRR